MGARIGRSLAALTANPYHAGEIVTAAHISVGYGHLHRQIQRSHSGALHGDESVNVRAIV